MDRRPPRDFHDLISEPRAREKRVLSAVKYGVLKVGLVVLGIGAVTPARAWGSSDAVVAGVVRDTHGVPQMGAVVELLGPDASIVGRAFTDDHGRYLLASVLPGNYQIRASAAFLLPVLRGNLRLRAGAHAVADLTMTAIFEAGAWLPTERRHLSEPADDWQWTLRSTASRPLLRLAGGSPISSSRNEVAPDGSKTSAYEGRLALLGGDGTFGQGGAYQVLSLDRKGADGDVQVMRASFGSGRSSGSPGPVTLAGGMERQSLLGGQTRIFATVAYHPELQFAGQTGVADLRSATTEKIVLGDSVVVDAGTLLSAERLLGSRFDSAPYIRVAFRSSAELTLEYRLATDRVLQRSEDLDGAILPEEVLSDEHGRPLSRKGLHQELVATHAEGNRILSVAVFRNSLPSESVQGDGRIGADALNGLPVITDPSTGTLRMALPGLSETGARASWTERVSPLLSACVEADLGKALAPGSSALQLESLGSELHAQMAAALSASVQFKTRRTGSAVNVSYRWQPHDTLTQVNEYDASPQDAYLSVGYKQKLWSGRRLKGLNAVMEATNLLAEGYEPVLGPDGQTLFLAQVPRGLLGGLAFSF